MVRQKCKSQGRQPTSPDTLCKWFAAFKPVSSSARGWRTVTSDWPETLLPVHCGDELQTCCSHLGGCEESTAPPPRSVMGAQVHSLSEVTGRGQEVF